MGTKNSGGFQLKYWVLSGLTGISLFFGLIDQFYFMANAPVSYSKEEAIGKQQSLYQELGINTDTLGTIPFRQQRVGLYDSILDSLGQSAPSPSSLNRENFYLNGWDVITASALRQPEVYGINAGTLYSSSGIYRTVFDNSGRIKSFELQAERGGKSRIEGELSAETAESVVQDIFGYDLSDYDLIETPGEEDAAERRIPEENGSQSLSLVPLEGPEVFKWQKRSGSFDEYIVVDLRTVFDMNKTISENYTSPVVSVDRFEAYHEMEKLPTSSTDDNFVVFFITMITLLGLIVFIEGLVQIFKGKADWKRILIIATCTTIGIYAWRLIYMLSFSELLTLQANIGLQFDQLAFGLIMGLLASLAYIGWEAFARGEKKFQIELIDAFWQGRIFFRETGTSILRGFSLGGVMLGITSVFLTLAGIYLYQSDSQFGFAEVINRPRFLTINLSIFITAALLSISMVGIVYNFFSRRIKRSTVLWIVSILFGGMMLGGLGRIFGTTGSWMYEVAMFIFIAIPLFAAYKLSGLVTVFAGLWLYLSFINILPYLGSASVEEASTAWIQILIMGGVLLYGIAARRNAPSSSTAGSYVPDYEKKIMRNMRFENEMQIARESQQKLMPFEPLMRNEYELHGYFLPSFEVGGDYFDYVESPKENGERHLTLTVVDVSGKSMRAAMQAVFTSGLLRSRMYTDQPSKILTEICPVIYEKTDAKTFITCLVSRFEPAFGKMKIAIAGHCLPILKRNGKATFLKAPEPRFPLGLRPKVDYQQLEIMLKPGDLVLYYSDGFPEAINEKGERIGFDRALEYVESMESENLSAKEICNKIKKFVEEFSVERLADDTTILCLKIK